MSEFLNKICSHYTPQQLKRILIGVLFFIFSTTLIIIQGNYPYERNITLFISWGFVGCGICYYALLAVYTIWKHDTSTSRTFKVLVVLFYFSIVPVLMVAGLIEYFDDVKYNNYITSSQYIDSMRIVKVNDSIAAYNLNIKNNILSDFNAYFSKEFTDSYYNMPVFNNRLDSIIDGYGFSIGDNPVSKIFDNTGFENFVDTRKSFCEEQARENKSTYYSEYSACLENLETVKFYKDTVFIDTTFISSPMVINGNTIRADVTNMKDSVVVLRIKEYVDNTIDILYVEFTKNQGIWTRRILE